MLEMRAIKLKNELEVLKKSVLKAIKLSNDLMVEQGKMMDEMDEKLNKILEKLEKGNKKGES